MPTTIAIAPHEESTLVLALTFTDASGGAVTPSAVTWSLHDDSGTVVNSRSNVSATPGATVTIVLSGADLAMPTTDRRRVLTVDAVYTSTEGVGLPLRDIVRFMIQPL